MPRYNVQTFCVFIVALFSFVSLAQCVATTTVDYTIANDLLGEPFKYSMQVSVPEGSVLLDVMEEARKTNSKYFSFATEPTSWGPFVTSINHLSGSFEEKTYWQFFSGKYSLDKGVGTYVPKNGEHIFAIFSKY